ncbi:MAG: DUF2505 domain-containing protein [Aeromicrobium sp.]
MRVKESFTYPDTDVETVYALITDPAFREEAVAAVGGQDIAVTIEPTGDGHTVTVIQTQPASVPDFIKKFVGESVMAKQTERWSGPNADGTRSAEVKFTVIGQPADMLAQAKLSGEGDVSFTVDGELKVNVPFIGKKIEPEIAKIISASLRSDVEQGIKRLS